MKLANSTMDAENIFLYMMLTGLLLIPVALWMTDFSQPIEYGWQGPWTRRDHANPERRGCADAGLRFSLRQGDRGGAARQCGRADDHCDRLDDRPAASCRTPLRSPASRWPPLAAVLLAIEPEEKLVGKPHESVARSAARTQGRCRSGIYSVCSSHPLVVEAALRAAAHGDGPALIEATSNQVNQFGGYTGMTTRRLSALRGRYRRAARRCRRSAYCSAAITWVRIAGATIRPRSRWSAQSSWSPTM